MAFDESNKAERDEVGKAGEDHENAVLFRARRRPRKGRRREVSNGGEDEGDKAEDTSGQAGVLAELSRDELVLLREAQQLRERLRTSNVPVAPRGVGKGGVSDLDARNEPAGIDGGADGLSTQFSAERGGLAIQERMDVFIQSGLRKKFGHLREEEPVKERPSVVDVESFEIPKQLQVEEGLQYDPTEGMPSAGLEEVDIPDAATDITKASKRHDAARKGRNRRLDEALTPGNLSSNFVYHRQKWKEANMPSGNADECVADKADVRESGGRRKADSEDFRKESQTVGKRSRHSIDAAFADRWKKRWRR